MAKKFEEPHYTDNLESLNLCDLRPKDCKSRVDKLQEIAQKLIPTCWLNDEEKDLRVLRKKRRNEEKRRGGESLASKLPKTIGWMGYLIEVHRGRENHPQPSGPVRDTSVASR